MNKMKTRITKYELKSLNDILLEDFESRDWVNEDLGKEAAGNLVGKVFPITVFSAVV